MMALHLGWRDESNLEESVALSDHMRKPLSGSEVLIKILLVRASCGVLPLDWPVEKVI